MFCVVIVILVLLLLGSKNDANDYEEMKQDLAIRQFRRKLVEQMSQIIDNSVLSGANHGPRKRARNPNKILNKVHEISTIVKDTDPVISKIIFPGFTLTTESQRDKSQSVEFKLTRSVTRSLIKSAKLFIYTDNPGQDTWGWRIEVVNATKSITKTYRIFSDAKLQHFIVSDILKAYLREIQNHTDQQSLILKLFDHNNLGGIRKIKNIMLMVSVTSSPRRFRRSTTPEQANWCTNTSLFCCLEDFVVTPSRINLQNLISPDLIHLNYCKGDCNDYVRRQSNYAKVLGLLKSSKISPLSARQLESMKSCCSPQGYSKIRIKYFNDQTQQNEEKIVHDMVVSSCGCF